MKKHIIRFLIKNRKTTVQSILDELKVDFQDILPVIKQLKTEEIIRFGRGCTGGCKVCRGLCSDTTKMIIRENTEIISLIRL